MDCGWAMLCAYLWMSQASEFLVLRRPEPLRLSGEKEFEGSGDTFQIESL